MSFSITVGSRNITSVGPIKDLKSNLQSDFRLPKELESHLDQPLSALPTELRSVAIDCDAGPSFMPGSGKFTFTLSAGVKSKLAVMLPGDTLLTYADDFQTDTSIGPEAKTAPPKVQTVTVPAGQAYVCVELQFKIGGGISVTAPVGTVGICASFNDQNTFGNAFYRKCSPTATLHDAIRDAFENYVLPLHPLTFSNLDVGDYLYHDFNACLQVGLGASIGYSKILFAAQTPSGIAGNALQAGIMALPSFQACAKLAFSFAYKSTFEALLWKESPTQGHMHLYRSKEQNTSLGLHLGVGLGPDAKEGAESMTGQLGGLMSKILPGGLGQKFAGNAADEMNNFAKEGSKKIADWLKPINQGKATLDLAIETTKQTFLLLDYTFDLTAPAFDAAWKTALAGDFVAALTTPNGGVQIGVGGGLEKLYSKKTSVHLNLFGQLNAVWSDATISNTSMVYAGNNTFHLMAEEGRQQLALINTSQREIDIYFAAQADSLGGNTKLGDIELHCVLKAANNPKYGKYLANFLNLMSPAVGQASLAQSVGALAAVPGTTEMIHLIFDQSSYGKLQASTITKGKPDNEAPDRQNYSQFEQACSKLFAESPANFSYNGQSLGYTIWQNWNIASNDQWPAPAGAVPDRTQPGNTTNGINAYLLGHEFPNAGNSDATLISYALQAASDFMNFCADLKSLATVNSAGSGTTAWDNLIERLKHIIQNDMNQDFVAPASLALTWLCTSQNLPAEIKGPAPSLEDKDSIAVSVTYS